MYTSLAPPESLLNNAVAGNDQGQPWWRWLDRVFLQTSVHRRPLGITLVALAYVLSPLLNSAQAVLINRLPLATVWRNALQGFGALGLTLILLGPLVGIAIYSGRRWGLLLFLGHAAAVLLNNTWLLAADGSAGAATFIGVDILVFAAVAFVLRKDLRAPYLAALPRGWRRAQRLSCRMSARLHIGGRERRGQTVNISRQGALLRLSSEDLCPEQEGALQLGDGVHTCDARARVVAIREGLVAVTLQDLSRQETRKLLSLAKRNRV